MYPVPLALSSSPCFWGLLSSSVSCLQRDGADLESLTQGSTKRKKEFPKSSAIFTWFVVSDPAIGCQSGLLRLGVLCRRMPVAPLAHDRTTFPPVAGRAICSIGSGYGLK